MQSHSPREKGHMSKRRKVRAKFKSQVVLQLLSGERSMAELVPGASAHVADGRQLETAVSGSRSPHIRERQRYQC